MPGDREGAREPPPGTHQRCADCITILMCMKVSKGDHAQLHEKICAGVWQIDSTLPSIINRMRTDSEQMGLGAMEETAISARFRLKVRCFNCKVDTVHTVDVPAADDAPDGIDELLDSQLLRNQSFTCRSCDAAIGVIVGVTEDREAIYA